MRISVNLASRPFVEIRPLLARLRLTMIGLAVLGIALVVGLNTLKSKADAATAQMDALKAQTAGYENRMVANEARMKQPQNRAVLDRARFLNELFAKKSFSWTAVMMDLETVLPSGVQVTSIDPAITKEGDVNIRLRVSGDRERAVLLVTNLEKSKRFLAPRLSNESLQTNQTNGGSTQQDSGVPGGVQFDILSGYNPLLAEETQETRKIEVPATGKAEVPAKRPAAKSVKPKKSGGPR